MRDPLLGPLQTWLSSAHGRRMTGGHFDGRSRVELHEHGRLMGLGRGADLGEAIADAVNDLVRRAAVEDEDLEACDRAFEEERAALERASSAEKGQIEHDRDTRDEGERRWG